MDISAEQTPPAETELNEEILGLTLDSAAELDGEIAEVSGSQPMPAAGWEDQDDGMCASEWMALWHGAEYNLARWGSRHGVWWAPVEHRRNAMSSFGLATAIIMHQVRRWELSPGAGVGHAVGCLYRQGADIGWALTRRREIAGTVGIPLLAARLATENVAERLEFRHGDPVGAYLARGLVHRLWPWPGTAFPPPGSRGEIFAAAMKLKRHIDHVHSPGVLITGLPELIKLGVIARALYPRAVFHVLRREAHSLT